jgi:hypothetical protein
MELYQVWHHNALNIGTMQDSPPNPEHGPGYIPPPRPEDIGPDIPFALHDPAANGSSPPDETTLYFVRRERDDGDLPPPLDRSDGANDTSPAAAEMTGAQVAQDDTSKKAATKPISPAASDVPKALEPPVSSRNMNIRVAEPPPLTLKTLRYSDYAGTEKERQTASTMLQNGLQGIAKAYEAVSGHHGIFLLHATPEGDATLQLFKSGDLTVCVYPNGTTGYQEEYNYAHLPYFGTRRDGNIRVGLTDLPRIGEVTDGLYQELLNERPGKPLVPQMIGIAQAAHLLGMAGQAIPMPTSATELYDVARSRDPKVQEINKDFSAFAAEDLTANIRHFLQHHGHDLSHSKPASHQIVEKDEVHSTSLLVDAGESTNGKGERYSYFRTRVEGPLGEQEKIKLFGPSQANEPIRACRSNTLMTDGLDEEGAPQLVSVTSSLYSCMGDRVSSGPIKRTSVELSESWRAAHILWNPRLTRKDIWCLS